MFLIDWPEPFGLSMIEAMACGTPVLAMRRGSVEEVVEDGLTGHIVDSIEEATVTLPRVMALDRRAVRRRFEERFTATRMAKRLCAGVQVTACAGGCEAALRTSRACCTRPPRSLPTSRVSRSIDDAGVRTNARPLTSPRAHIPRRFALAPVAA